MQRSQRLGVVLELEERREQTALDRLNQVRGHWDSQRERLAELQRYQSDYRDQMRESQHGVVPVSRLQGWQAFIAQLDSLVGQQEQQVERARAQFERARDAWREAYERRRGMQRHIEYCRRQERQAEDLREQKQADEASSQAFMRRSKR